MKFIITGRKLEVTPGIKSRIENKLGKLSKFFSDDTEVHVTLRTSKDRHIVEVTIPANGVLLRAEEVSDDLYYSIDHVVSTLERQIRKNKTRLQKRLRSEGFTEAVEFFGASEEEDSLDVVKVKEIDVKPMSPDEAILQMNLLGHTFFVFRDAQSEKICVVYKRNDGHYGMIEPK